MKWTLRKTAMVISHEVDLKKNLQWVISQEVAICNGSYLMKWTLRKTCKWFISHEVDLKKNLQMVHIS